MEREQPTRSSWAPFPSPNPAVGAAWWGKEEHTIRRFIPTLSHFAKAKEKGRREREEKQQSSSHEKHWQQTLCFCFCVPKQDQPILWTFTGPLSRCQWAAMTKRKSWLITFLIWLLGSGVLGGEEKCFTQLWRGWRVPSLLSRPKFQIYVQIWVKQREDPPLTWIQHEGPPEPKKVVPGLSPHGEISTTPQFFQWNSRGQTHSCSCPFTPSEAMLILVNKRG